MSLIKQISVCSLVNGQKQWITDDIGASAGNIDIKSSNGETANIAGENNLYKGLTNILPSLELNKNKILITDNYKKIWCSETNSSQLQYLNRVHSDIQNQIDNKISKSGDIITGNLEIEASANADRSIIKDTFFQSDFSSEYSNINIINPTNIIKVKTKLTLENISSSIGRIAAYDRRLEPNSSFHDWGLRFDVYDGEENLKTALRLGVDPETGESYVGVNPIKEFRRALSYGSEAILIPPFASTSLARDTDGFLISSTITEKGLYLIWMKGIFPKNATGSYRKVSASINDNKDYGSVYMPPFSDIQTHVLSSFPAYLNENDVVKIVLKHNASSSLASTASLRLCKLI